MITRPRFFIQIAVVISTISLVFVGIIFAIFELYGKLKRALIEKYKTVDINESYESHKKFINEDQESFIVENAKYTILKQLKDTFAPVIDEFIRQVKTATEQIVYQTGG